MPLFECKYFKVIWNDMKNFTFIVLLFAYLFRAIIQP